MDSGGNSQMAKLYLKFEQAVLKEHTLAQGVTTIGRLPDNTLQIDNLAVSGHHCKIYWDADHYVVEDNNSLNGTYVNNQRINRAILKDGDSVLVGKHVLSFKDAWHEDQAANTPAAERTTPPISGMEATVVMGGKAASQILNKPTAAATATARERVGTLTIMDGKTDAAQYTLGGKLTVIGKSEMATVHLKGWFAPKVAANIMKRDGKYLIAAAEKDMRVKINGEMINGHYELQEGDIIEVAKIKAQFAFQD